MTEPADQSRRCPAVQLRFEVPEGVDWSGVTATFPDPVVSARVTFTCLLCWRRALRQTGHLIEVA